MKKEKYKELVKEYETYSNIQLARQYVKVDSEVNLLWNDVDDEISYLRELLNQIIIERFIKSHIEIEWDESLDNGGNWNVPGREIGCFYEDIKINLEQQQPCGKPQAAAL